MSTCTRVAASPELPVWDVNRSVSVCLALASRLPGLAQCNMPVRVTGSYPVTVSVNQLPETEAESALLLWLFIAVVTMAIMESQHSDDGDRRHHHHHHQHHHAMIRLGCPEDDGRDDGGESSDHDHDDGAAAEAEAESALLMMMMMMMMMMTTVVLMVTLIVYVDSRSVWY